MSQEGTEGSQNLHTDQLDLTALRFFQTKGLVVGGEFPFSILDDLLFSSPPLPEELLSALLGPGLVVEGGQQIATRTDYLLIPLLLEDATETGAFTELNERLGRERTRRGGVGLAQLAEMISNVLNEVK
jgi:hypothetical protein